MDCQMPKMDGFEATKAIRQIDLVPGDTRVLRAAFVFIMPREASAARGWVSAWTPWLRTTPPPDDAAFHLPTGARLLVEQADVGSESELQRVLDRIAGGMPALRASSASASAEQGVSEAGFTIRVQPAASAGPAFRAIIAIGKFHGVIAAHTPIG